jgi:hypothetical protein
MREMMKRFFLLSVVALSLSVSAAVVAQEGPPPAAHASA